MFKWLVFVEKLANFLKNEFIERFANMVDVIIYIIIDVRIDTTCLSHVLKILFGKNLPSSLLKHKSSIHRFVSLLNHFLIFFGANLVINLCRFRQSIWAAATEAP